MIRLIQARLQPCYLLFVRLNESLTLPILLLLQLLQTLQVEFHPQALTTAVLQVYDEQQQSQTNRKDDMLKQLLMLLHLPLQTDVLVLAQLVVIHHTLSGISPAYGVTASLEKLKVTQILVRLPLLCSDGSQSIVCIQAHRCLLSLQHLFIILLRLLQFPLIK